MPSFAGYVNSSVRRLRRVEYAVGMSNKLRFLLWAFADSVPRAIIETVPAIGKLLSYIPRHIHFERIVVQIAGIRFLLVDQACFDIVGSGFEHWIWSYLRPKRGEVFLDVGAHVGKYALRVAKSVGENGLVIAFEPMPRNYEALLRGIKINNLQNVIALNVAAWNENSKLKLFLANSHSDNSIKCDFGLGLVDVTAKTIDHALEELGISRVDLIKIDVERAEFEVLQGARATLERNNPRVIVEVWNENGQKISEFMKDLNYNVYSIDDSKSSEICYYCFTK